MPPRLSWKAFLRLGLVTIPVQGYNTLHSGGGQIHLNQLHAECNSRIRYKKVCPIHGEVSKEEIVSGYEYAKDQYVVIESDEIDRLRRESDKAINLRAFVAPEEVDPVYYDGRTYYLLPDGQVGQKPYVVLARAMQQQGRFGVGQMVLSGREQLVLVRPIDELLVLEILNYADQVRSSDDFRKELGETGVGKEELKLAAMLIDASTPDRFDLAGFEDEYTHRLRGLIEAKVEGREVVVPPAEEAPAVINLMDALRQSVAQAKQATADKGKPPRKMAPSRRKQAGAKRKSS